MKKDPVATTQTALGKEAKEATDMLKGKVVSNFGVIGQEKSELSLLRHKAFCGYT